MVGAVLKGAGSSTWRSPLSPDVLNPAGSTATLAIEQFAARLICMGPLEVARVSVFGTWLEEAERDGRFSPGRRLLECSDVEQRSGRVKRTKGVWVTIMWKEANTALKTDSASERRGVKWIETGEYQRMSQAYL